MIRAIVRSVITSKHYAVAEMTEGSNLRENATFNLASWTGQHPPAPDQVVHLEDVTQFAKGWRAAKAHPITASATVTAAH